MLFLLSFHHARPEKGVLQECLINEWIVVTQPSSGTWLQVRLLLVKTTRFKRGRLLRSVYTVLA